MTPNPCGYCPPLFDRVNLKQFLKAFCGTPHPRKANNAPQTFSFQQQGWRALSVKPRPIVLIEVYLMVNESGLSRNRFWRRGKKSALSQIVPYGKSKIQDLIKRQIWREGLHYVTDDAGDRLYNLDLIADWVANMNDPVAHERACELYLSSLLSNQTAKKRRGLAA